MIPSVVRGYLNPPSNPDECIFSKTTACLSADLKQPITPCQERGQSGLFSVWCMASVGLQALGDYRLGGLIPLSSIFKGSLAVGAGVGTLREAAGHSHG